MVIGTTVWSTSMPLSEESDLLSYVWYVVLSRRGVVGGVGGGLVSGVLGGVVVVLLGGVGFGEGVLELV